MEGCEGGTSTTDYSNGIKGDSCLRIKESTFVCIFTYAIYQIVLAGKHGSMSHEFPFKEFVYDLSSEQGLEPNI